MKSISASSSSLTTLNSKAFDEKFLKDELLNLNINVVIQTHDAIFENLAIFFLIRFIENFFRVSDQNVDFFDEMSRNRNALSRSKKVKI